MVDAVATLGIRSHTLLTVSLQMAIPKTVKGSRMVMRMKITLNLMNDFYTVQV